MEPKVTLLSIRMIPSVNANPRIALMIGGR